MSSERIALVTGANKGIGRQIAAELCARGFKVQIGARKHEAGKKTAEELGSRASFLPLDVSDDTSISEAVRQFSKDADRLDVLINNAGIYPDEGLNILTISRDRLMETFQTNTFGALRVTQAFLPLLEKSERAKVINVSSGYGELGGLSAQVPSYCLSKLTLNGITIMLDQFLRPKGISVYVMCPGWVRTDMGGSGASRSVEQGADTAVWLATEAPGELSGKFFRDRKVIDW